MFYTGMSLCIAALVFVGFARSWFLARWFAPPEGTPEIGPLLIAHGAVFTTWVLLSVIQPSLIAAGRTDVHRRLGYAAAGIAVLMVFLGNAVAIAAIHVGYIGLGDPYVFYAIPFFDIQTFALFAALAIIRRRRPQEHKRLMLLASTQLLEPAMARMPIAAFQAGMPYASLFGSDFVIVAGVIYDLATRRRINPVWLWGGAVVVLSGVVRLLIQNSASWISFAHFMASVYVPK